MVVFASEGKASIRGCDALVSATFVWKLLPIRCTLPQYADLSSSDFYESVIWEVLQSLHQGIDMLFERSTIIIFWFNSRSLPKDCEIHVSANPSISSLLCV